jgi:Holliday junction resolvasome RuvABC endonuclease subunit
MIIVGIDPSINGTGVVKFYLDPVDLKLGDMEYMGFTQVKKHSSNKIIHYRKKDFENNLDQNLFMYDEIRDFCEDAEYIAIEDYAYSATGKVFNIAEYVGGLKMDLYLEGKKIRMIEPTVVKKYAVGRGSCDKISMEDEYMKNDVLGLSKLPEYKSPKLDIVDAFYIAKYLQLELQLRFGYILLKNLSQEHIQIFNRVTKSNPVNILARDFLERK